MTSVYLDTLFVKLHHFPRTGEGVVARLLPSKTLDATLEQPKLDATRHDVRENMSAFGTPLRSSSPLVMLNKFCRM